MVRRHLQLLTSASMSPVKNTGWGSELVSVLSSEDGFVDRDWDEPSELARLVRYATLMRELSDGGPTLSFAAGELGFASLGHGALVGRYASGSVVDHRRLGAHVGLVGGRFAAEALIDDVVKPRILAGRAEVALADRWRIAGSTALDFSIPIEEGTRIATLLATEISYGTVLARGSTGGRLYAALSTLFGAGLGGHAGARGQLALGEWLRLSALVEGVVSGGGYQGGWFGPLYEIERFDRWSRAERGEFGGIGAAFEFGAEVVDLGQVEGRYAVRPGDANVATARVQLPTMDPLQLALMGAVSHENDTIRDAILAAEARCVLPRSLYLGIEVARLYEGRPMMSVAPFWLVTATLGAVWQPGSGPL